MEAPTEHAYDQPVRLIEPTEPVLIGALLTAAQTWATLNPRASTITREYLAALVRVELMAASWRCPRLSDDRCGGLRHAKPNTRPCRRPAVGTSGT